MIHKDTIMVTGGCGAIGNHVVIRLAKKYPDSLIVNLDAQTYAALNVPDVFNLPNYRLVVGNICDSKCVMEVLNTYSPRIIVHLAAETHVDKSFGNSYKFTETNVFGTHTLLECCRIYGKLDKFIHMSTDEVYGSVDDNDVSHEKSLLAPSNPYSASKAAAEMFCHAYLKSFNLPIIIMRCNNAISRYQHEEKLVPRVVTNIMEGIVIPVHGNGLSKRTFIHADDIAEAIDVILQKGEISYVYNIGSSQEYTVLEVIQEILAIMKPQDSLDDWIEFVPDRAFQDMRYSVDATELAKLGWKSQISFQEAVMDVIESKLNA